MVIGVIVDNNSTIFRLSYRLDPGTLDGVGYIDGIDGVSDELKRFQRWLQALEVMLGCLIKELLFSNGKSSL